MQNGAVSLPSRLFLVCAVLLGGCGWDGPAAAVRVVPEVDADTTGAGRDDQPQVGDQGAGDDRTGVDGDDTTGAAAGSGDAPHGDQRPATGPAANDGGADQAILPPFPATVAVVGDSLTLSARDEITTELVGLGLEVMVVDGVESRRMTAGSAGRPSGLDAIATIRAELDVEPDLWVIALGTNDVGAQVDEQRFRDDVRAALSGVGTDSPVVWVDIWIRDRREAAVAANGVIRDELAGRTAPSGVVGWFAHAGGDGLVTDDGVHLTDRGQAAFATAIANQVRTIYHR